MSKLITVIPANSTPSGNRGDRLRALAFLFLKIGLTAFGGPTAHIAIMEDEVVRRRLWMTREEFLDLLGATNLIPGPNSTEMAIHIGYRRAGFPGLLVAGISFIFPSALIVGGIAWTYVQYGALPQFKAILYGIKPVVVAIVFQALLRLGKTALKSWWLWLIGLAAVILYSAGVGELLVLALAGFVAAAFAGGRFVRRVQLRALALPMSLAGVASVSATFSLGALFVFFLKVGSVLFGSGYVLLAFLKADLVDRWGWISQTQLMDAIAVGQVTPGPVFTTATFIGYVLAGPSGAALATVGIFLPAFIFVALSNPLIPRIRRAPLAAAFLDGLNVGSLALMAVVSLQLAHGSLNSGLTVGLALASAALLSFGVNSAVLTGVGAVAGLLFS